MQFTGHTRGSFACEVLSRLYDFSRVLRCCRAIHCTHTTLVILQPQYCVWSRSDALSEAMNTGYIHSPTHPAIESPYDSFTSLTESLHLQDQRQFPKPKSSDDLIGD
jgi:hypothetical protein